jgi:sugar phosphate isomerase/epimerase
MRLAFSTLGCPNWTLEQVVDGAAEYGYDGIELRLLDGEPVGPSMGDEARRRVRSALRGSGLELCCLDTSFGIADPEEALNDAIRSIDLAADVGAPMIRLFGGAPEGEPVDTTIRRTTERLAILAERGREAGVTIALETHDSFASGASTARILAGAAVDVRVVWDTLNTFVTGEAPEVSLRHVADRLVHVHVKDGGHDDEPERNELFGEGVVPLDSIVAMLTANGYDGWLSVEWEKYWQPSIAEPEVALPRYADALRAALAAAANQSRLTPRQGPREGRG